MSSTDDSVTGEPEEQGDPQQDPAGNPGPPADKERQGGQVEGSSDDPANGTTNGTPAGEDSASSKPEIPGFSVSWTSPEGEVEEGPMEVLWQLIESYKIDIFDVSLNKITDDFISFMRLSNELKIEHASSFTVMSSRLLFYKSKALLPDPGFEENDPDPRLPPELIQQLLEYRKFQMAAEKMRDIEEISAGMLTRDTKMTAYPQDPDNTWLDVTLVDLVRAYSDVLKRFEGEDDKFDMEITMEEFNVEAKIKLIKDMLEEAVSFSFEDLFDDAKNKGDIIATFLAILELTKLGEIIVRQKSTFDEIQIFKKSIVVR